MLTIDGSMGEGGGQILRSALGLSLVTGRPFRIEQIRRNRKRPGLLRQHLTCVQAVASIGAARVDGDQLGSPALTFEPGGVRAGDYRFAMPTAGSTSLVLQAILPALLVAPSASRVVIEGGTHNPWAPPFEFLVQSFLPLLARMGADVAIGIERPGFHPAGGGRIAVTVQPVGAPGLRPLRLLERGQLVRREAIAHVANLPQGIAERELAVVARKLGFARSELRTHTVQGSRGPGNVVTIVLEFANVTEACTGFGEVRKPAERVAGEAVREAKEYLASDAPVGQHLADQLLLPMALAGKGTFRALPLSRHAQANIEVIRMFLPVEVRHGEVDRVATVEIGGG